jgi:hypothetical protein
VKGVYEEIRSFGGEVLVISFGAPALVRLHVEATRPPFPIIADPSRDCYRAFGLERMPWARMLRLGFIGRCLKLVGRGWLPQMRYKGDDAFQLGGDFILDADRRLVLGHRSE